MSMVIHKRGYIRVVCFFMRDRCTLQVYNAQQADRDRNACV
jgi:hypothetical protein